MDHFALDKTSIALITAVVLIAAGYAANYRFRFTGIPDLPWVGKQHGFLADLRTRLSSMGNARSMVELGYKKYSKFGRNFVLPDFDRAMIVVPDSQIKWLADQPDDVLSSKAMQVEVLQSDWTLLDPSIARNPIHEIIIRRDLTRSIGKLIPEIDDELKEGVDQCWGKDTKEWKEIGLFDSMVKIVAQTTNRIFVGLPLCRNEEYLRNAGAFATDIAISAALIRLIPSILRPVLAWLVIIPNRWHLYKCSKYLLPLIKQRTDELESLSSGESKEKPNDFTTWYLEEVAEHPDLCERAPEKVVKRLMAVNFAAIHTSTFTATNMLFDLISSRNAAENIQELREEIQGALSENHGKWDKISLSKLIKVDSAIRESLRVSTFMMTGMDRMVLSPTGVTMQDGLHLPQGSRVGTSTFSIHHDNSIYEDAKSYDPFRFSRIREHNETAPASVNGEKQKDLTKLLEAKNLSIVTTSDSFLSFGHGKHACPGRFFAATEMKLLLAYIILNYDIRTMETRPPNGHVGAAILPPMKATISIKRRTE